MMNLEKWKYVAVQLLLLGEVIIVYLVILLGRFPSQSSDVFTEYLIEKLKWVSSELETMKQQIRKQNAQNKSTTGNHQYTENIESKPHSRDIKNPLLQNKGPSTEYEDMRRRIYFNTKELVSYVNKELEKAAYKRLDLQGIKQIQEAMDERKRFLLSDQEKLAELDGYQEWRRYEADQLSDLVQRRLSYLQNPPDCQEARKVYCDFDNCGFGCQVHHIAYCLIFAYATERTLILNSRGSIYGTKWDYVFQPLSENCTHTYSDSVLPWTVSRNAKVVSLPLLRLLKNKPKYLLPLSIPRDLADRIGRFNDDPPAWWVGQMVKYIMRLQPVQWNIVKNAITKKNLQSPIVGVHIRRTNMKREAAFHKIDEYMSHVANYYSQLELTRTVNVRRAYLATNDIKVLKEARKKYAQYKFYSDSSIANSAAIYNRHTPLSLTGLLVDLHMLAMCDYIVCTLSSNFGRMAYEMVQTKRVGALKSFSLTDEMYYFGEMNAFRDRIAVMANSGERGDIQLNVGDLIGVSGEYDKGYRLGTNKRTNQYGIIPWYKTADFLEQYPFPDYKQVRMYDSRIIHHRYDAKNNY